MTSSLQNLVGAGKPLTAEPPDPREIEGLQRSGLARLCDARNATLSLESRFDLAYNAAHALSPAALRAKGFRPSNRCIVFQSLKHTLGVGREVWRVLDKCHQQRNIAEYEGELGVSGCLVENLIAACEAVRVASGL
ncbi:hypothetical protein [Stenotrophomonas sp. NPDC077659]|uniref:hypothetical protein n=1 Tax=Stenotrophomonas sp. NPDC077659 TaxID=3390694 RepID=UPI003D02AC8A